jgi:hypothetical protein
MVMEKAGRNSAKAVSAGYLLVAYDRGAYSHRVRPAAIS